MFSGKNVLQFFANKRVHLTIAWTLSILITSGTLYVLLRSEYLRNELKSNILIKARLSQVADKLQSFQYQVTDINKYNSPEGDSAIFHYWGELKRFSEELEEYLILDNKYQVEHFKGKYLPKIQLLNKHISENTLVVQRKAATETIIQDLKGIYTQIVETTELVTNIQRQLSTELNLLWTISLGILAIFCLLVGPFLAMVYTIIRISAKNKIISKQLEKAETKLSETQQLGKIGSWDIDLTSGEHSFSEQFFALYEAYTPDEQQQFYNNILKNSQNSFWKNIHIDDLNNVKELIEKKLKSYTAFDVEYRIVTTTGKVRYLRNTVKFIKNQTGEAVKLSGTVQDITSYKSLLNKLSTNNYLLQGILESTQEQIIALDVQFNYITFNQTHAKFMKLFTLRDIEVGGCMLDYYSDTKGQQYVEEKARSVLQGSYIKNEYQKVKNATNNELIHILYSAYPIYNQQNKVRGVAIFVSNITQQVNTEIEKKNQEEKYARLIENMTESVVYFDTAVKIIFANPSFYELTQIKTKPTLFNDFSQIFTNKADQELFNSLTTKTLSGEQTYLEAAITGDPNQFAWVKMASVPIYDTNREINGFMITITNLTKHKELEDALSQSEQRIRHILENTQTMLLIHDTEGYVIEANKAVLENFHYSKEEFTGKNIKEFLPEEHAEFFDTYLEKIIHQKADQGYMTIFNKNRDRRIAAYKNIYVEADPPYIIASSIDVTEDIRTRKEIEKQKALIQQIISISPNLIFVKNQHQEYILVNQSFADFFHKKAAEIIGTTDKELVKESHLIRFYEAMDTECIKNPYQIFTYEHSLQHDDQEKRFFFTKMSFLSNNEQMILGISTDITRQYEYQKEIEQINIALKDNNAELNATLDKLQETYEKLTQTMRVKDDFMANMSHEIRTPLNAIIGFADLLQQTTLSEKQNQYTRIVHQASEKLLQIINDLLDFNKLESGKIVLHPAEFHVKEAVLFLQNLFEFKVREKNLSFLVDYSPNIPPILVGDISRLHQVLINLLGNACKFTLQGSVTLSVGVEKRTQEHCWLSFEIIDTGIGIPEDKLTTIFERFEQVSSGINRKFEGTGLGLSITKNFVELMHGTITVSSVLGKGSTFRIVIPFRIPDPTTITEPITVAPEEAIPNQLLTILAVEDNPLNQILVKKVLENLGHTVTIASDGEKAIHQLFDNKYDIVLMDIQMPVLDGYQTIEKIRNELFLSIPVIALTAHSSEEEKERCLASGFNGYITKPFKPNELQKLIMTTWMLHINSKTT
ncbi:MAG: PAS domain S-box protein [Bacteroidia bacterium]|nr:PAS domain S-box protein [Bacteroidia bacterium]